jgi:hypothetical protein
MHLPKTTVDPTNEGEMKCSISLNRGKGYVRVKGTRGTSEPGLRLDVDPHAPLSNDVIGDGGFVIESGAQTFAEPLARAQVFQTHPPVI